MLVMVDFFLYGRWARMLGIMAGIKSGGGRTEKSGKKIRKKSKKKKKDLFTSPSCPAARARSLFQSTTVAGSKRVSLFASSSSLGSSDSPGKVVVSPVAVAMETNSSKSSSRCRSRPNDVQSWPTSPTVTSDEPRALNLSNGGGGNRKYETKNRFLIFDFLLVFVCLFLLFESLSWLEDLRYFWLAFSTAACLRNERPLGGVAWNNTVTGKSILLFLLFTKHHNV